MCGPALPRTFNDLRRNIIPIVVFVYIAASQVGHPPPWRAIGNAIPLDFPSTGGQQWPTHLQAVNSIVGLDTKFSDSFLIRIEAQPGFYGTTFDHLDGDSFNVPFVSAAPTFTLRNCSSSSASG
jgi:hypothetical protein